MTLSGFTLTRRCLTLDYCFELAIQSMLPVCDEVVVCDSDSDDGTREFLDEWAAHEPKLRIINWPWPNPVGEKFFYVRWVNYCREHLRGQSMLHIEADECLHENSYPAILRAAKERRPTLFRRWNFWRDTEHLSPDGTYCGTEVARLGPTNLWMSSDAPDPHGPQTLVTQAINGGLAPGCEIYHYGALRKPDAFVEKSKVMQGAIFNSMDSRLLEAQKQGVHWESLCHYNQSLVHYPGRHPVIAEKWLRDRGYSPRT